MALSLGLSLSHIYIYIYNREREREREREDGRIVKIRNQECVRINTLLDCFEKKKNEIKKIKQKLKILNKLDSPGSILFYLFSQHLSEIMDLFSGFSLRRKTAIEK